MKKKRNEISRIEEIINSDRLCASDEFSRLLNVDLTNLLREYFDFNDNVGIEIAKHGNVYTVDISLVVNKLFRFSKIPE